MTELSSDDNKERAIQDSIGVSTTVPLKVSWKKETLITSTSVLCPILKLHTYLKAQVDQEMWVDSAFLSPEETSFPQEPVERSQKETTYQRIIRYQLILMHMTDWASRHQNYTDKFLRK